LPAYVKTQQLPCTASQETAKGVLSEPDTKVGRPLFPVIKKRVVIFSG